MTDTRIKELRERFGWSRKELATKLNVNEKTVANWEAGRFFPSMENIFKLMKVFFVTCDYLICLTDEYAIALHGLSPKEQKNFMAMLEAEIQASISTKQEKAAQESL